MLLKLMKIFVKFIKFFIRKNIHKINTEKKKYNKSNKIIADITLKID